MPYPQNQHHRDDSIWRTSMHGRLRTAAGSLPGPDDGAILAHQALVGVIAIDLSLKYKLDPSKIGREIVRIGNVLKRLGKEFIDRVTENAAQGSVDPEPSAVGSDVCDSNRRMVERGSEPRLAVAC